MGKNTYNNVKMRALSLYSTTPIPSCSRCPAVESLGVYKVNPFSKSAPDTGGMERMKWISQKKRPGFAVLCPNCQYENMHIKDRSP